MPIRVAAMWFSSYKNRAARQFGDRPVENSVLFFSIFETEVFKKVSQRNFSRFPSEPRALPPFAFPSKPQRRETC
jgi:hypothetical protein